MLPALFIILLVVLAVRLTLYLTLLFKPKSSKAIELKNQLTTLRNQLSGISAMDEFARWAKLRRKIDSATKDYETETSNLDTLTTSFNIKYAIGSRIFKYLVYTIIALFYLFTPMFYVKDSWFGPFGMSFAMPFSPSGSVGSFYWVYSVDCVISKLIDSIHSK